MAGRVLSLFKALRGKTKKGPAPAPAPQPEQPEQLQPLQDDAGKERTQEQDPARGRFRRAAQALRRFLRIRRRKTRAAATEGTAQPDSRPGELRAKPDAGAASSEGAANADRAKAEARAEADVALSEGMATTNTHTQAISKTGATPTWTAIPAPTLEFFQERGVSSQQLVPAMVRDIHQTLVSRVTVDAELQIHILSLAEGHPAHVVMSLLRCAPSCDRAAALMWRAIGSSGEAAEMVLPPLLSVMEGKPLYSTFFFGGDDEAVFALAATLVLWKIAHMPEWHYVILLHSAHLFVALLVQIFITTEQLPQEVENFWRACREEHRLPTEPNRFLAQTMKLLLCVLRRDKQLVALERKRVWDTLLCADTQHYAAGLLAREMRQWSTPLCPLMALHLLSVLIGRQPRWHLPALAFFVEVLECLDLSQHGHSALLVMSRHLPSECRDRLRLELKGLVVLSKEPSLGGGMRGLYRHLVEQLADPDVEMLGMTLSVLKHMLQEEGLKIPCVTAPKLAEPLLPHFDNDNSHVQLLSIQLFQKVTEMVAEDGEQPLTRIVRQSLLPLFLRWHDENRSVAKASHEALLCAARFLRRRDLEELLTKEKRMMFAERLLLEDESRAAEHLRWALPCLQSPQKPLRQAAVGFIGIAGVLVMGQKEELQVLSEALQALRNCESSSFSKQLIQLVLGTRCADLRLLDQKNQPPSATSSSH